MPIPIRQVTVKVVHPAREVFSKEKNSKGVSLTLDFGKPGYPDHWYASAWNLESIDFVSEFDAGSEICISGDIRKYKRNGETKYTVNITDIFELTDDNLNMNLL